MSAADESWEEELHIEREISDEDKKFDVQELIRQVQENDPRVRSIRIRNDYNKQRDDID